MLCNCSLTLVDMLSGFQVVNDSERFPTPMPMKYTLNVLRIYAVYHWHFAFLLLCTMLEGKPGSSVTS